MVVGSAKRKAARCALCREQCAACLRKSANCRRRGAQLFCLVSFLSFSEAVGFAAPRSDHATCSRCAAPATLGHAPFAPAPLTLAAGHARHGISLMRESPMHVHRLRL